MKKSCSQDVKKSARGVKTRDIKKKEVHVIKALDKTDQLLSKYKDNAVLYAELKEIRKEISKL